MVLSDFQMDFADPLGEALRLHHEAMHLGTGSTSQVEFKSHENVTESHRISWTFVEFPSLSHEKATEKWPQKGLKKPLNA